MKSPDDLSRYKGCYPWVDAMIKELEELRAKNEMLQDKLARYIQSHGPTCKCSACDLVSADKKEPK